MDLLWVGIGGAIGAVGRYVVGRELTERIAGLFPYGTFTVNIVGAFVIGVLFVVLTERSIGDDYLRLLLVTGFLGGFTTFSSYTIEAINLAEGGQWGTALLYVLSSNVLGLLACLAGIGAVRWVS
jgi:CrcB protein